MSEVQRKLLSYQKCVICVFVECYAYVRTYTHTPPPHTHIHMHIYTHARTHTCMGTRWNNNLRNVKGFGRRK